MYQNKNLIQNFLDEPYCDDGGYLYSSDPEESDSMIQSNLNPSISCDISRIIEDNQIYNFPDDNILPQENNIRAQATY